MSSLISTAGSVPPANGCVPSVATADRKHRAVTTNEWARSPPGYPLRSGVPGSLVGDQGTATMTNFTTSAFRFPQATGARDRDGGRTDIFGRLVTLVPVRTSS